MTDEGGALPLEEDLRGGRIERALLCHVHDRWYLGELFCHASWLGSLSSAGIPCPVCTNPAYLELFEHLPGVDLFPAQDLDEALLERFDLVILGTTHPPDGHDPRLPRAIYAWNEGLAFARHGQVEMQLSRPAPNLFVATCHRHGETALSDGEYPSLHLAEAELAAGRRPPVDRRVARPGRPGGGVQPQRLQCAHARHRPPEGSREQADR